MKDCETYLITGGSRSGKSRYALELAKFAEKPFYIATAAAGDDEMTDRIKKHQSERGERWKTIEEEINLADAIESAKFAGADCIVVDCLTLWTSNIMFNDTVNLDNELEKVLNSIATASTTLIFVTNEVGSGIVPANKLSREFRDSAGIVNQKIAAAVKNVVLTVSGIPVHIKPQPGKSQI
jgi:adenosylcobinamide kinase/adenosylcobinamide-phosphate guanylyltransferase